MTFTQLFAIYYTLFRGEDSPPSITDPEWTVAINLYNNAVNRMVAMDDTKWNFLFTTLQSSAQVSPALVRTLGSGVTTYAAPTDMAEPGGILTYIDTSGNAHNYPIIQPHEVQIQSEAAHYGYFTGDSQNGFTLHINPAPSTTEVGYSIDYMYYKKPTALTTSETGSSIVAGGDPAFYYNHMLANRFRTSENYPAYQTALRDAEEALKGMKLKNNSGTYYSAWGVQDTGPGWGDTSTNDNIFGD